MMICRLLVFLPFIVLAQGNEVIRRIPIKEKVLEAEVDRLGNFYIRTEKTLTRYSPDGDVMASYAWADNENPIQVSSWNPLQILIHLRDHHFLLLDQELQRIPEPDQIDEAFAVKPALIAAGNLNHIAWVLDSDFSIKKIDWSASQVLMESYPFPKEQQPKQPLKLRAYQDFLFLLDGEAGLFVVGRTGKLARVIPFQKQSGFGVLGEDIFVCANNQLRFIDFYTSEEYQVDLPKGTLTAVATDERVLIVQEKQLIIQSFRPKVD